MTLLQNNLIHYQKYYAFRFSPFECYLVRSDVIINLRMTFNSIHKITLPSLTCFLIKNIMAINCWRISCFLLYALFFFVTFSLNTKTINILRVNIRKTTNCISFFTHLMKKRSSVWKLGHKTIMFNCLFEKGHSVQQKVKLVNTTWFTILL